MKRWVDVGPAKRIANELVSFHGSAVRAAAACKITHSQFLRVLNIRGDYVESDTYRRLRDAIEHKSEPRPVNAIVGDSEPIQDFRDRVERLSRFPFTSAIFVGESGTGKSLAARYLHDIRSDDTHFIEINMAALPSHIVESELFGHEKGAFTGAVDKKAGLFEIAGTGTVFLDEVDSMPLDVQAKLLTALERRYARRVGAVTEYPINASIVAAASERLYDNIRDRLFRHDLYHRLAVHTIEAPPLREHSGDIQSIAESFILEYHFQHGTPRRKIDPEAVGVLKGYHWPGNVRELRSVVERLLALDRNVTTEDVRHAIGRPVFERSDIRRPGSSEFRFGTGRTLADLERAYIESELQRDISYTDLAASLGISKKTLWEKRKRWGVG